MLFTAQIAGVRLLRAICHSTAALVCCSALIPLVLVLGCGLAEWLQPLLPEGLEARKSARYAAFLLLLLAWPWLDPGGWRRPGQWSVFVRLLVRGMLYGLVLGLLLEAMLLGLGLHVPRPSFSGLQLLQEILKGVVTGCGVALLEESVFRGVLLGGLRHHFGVVAAIVVSSLVFAVLHFPDYRFLDAGSLFWERGLAIIPAVMVLLKHPGPWQDAGLALFLLGTLLAVMRVQDGNLGRCIGVHLAVVALLRPVRYLTETRPDEWAVLVSEQRPPLGLLAAALFAAALAWQLTRFDRSGDVIR